MCVARSKIYCVSGCCSASWLDKCFSADVFWEWDYNHREDVLNKDHEENMAQSADAVENQVRNKSKAGNDPAGLARMP